MHVPLNNWPCTALWCWCLELWLAIKCTDWWDINHRRAFHAPLLFIGFWHGRADPRSKRAREKPMRPPHSFSTYCKVWNDVRLNSRAHGVDFLYSTEEAKRTCNPFLQLSSSHIWHHRSNTLSPCQSELTSFFLKITLMHMIRSWFAIYDYLLRTKNMLYEDLSGRCRYSWCTFLYLRKKDIIKSLLHILSRWCCKEERAKSMWLDPVPHNQEYIKIWRGKALMRISTSIVWLVAAWKQWQNMVGAS